MSNDTLDGAVVVGTKSKKPTNKSKSKSKSKDKHSKQVVVEVQSLPIEDQAADLAEAPEVQTEEKKKKKRRRDEEKLRDTRKAKTNESTMVDAMVVDSGPSTEPLNAEKKKKKKTKINITAHNTEATAESMLVDTQAQDASSSDKEKRKRKREADNGEDEGTSEAKKEKREKKKRRKEEAAARASSSSTPAQPSSSSTSKAPSPRPAAISSTSLTSAESGAAFLAKHSVTIHTPPSAPSISPIISFSQLSFLPEGLKGAFKTFKEPSPIQACTWPPALDGKDVVGIAETGSGKTLAFGIPAICKIINSSSSPSAKNSSVSVLVVAPTRELAIQTHETLSELGKPFGIASVAVFGGVSKEGQVKMLQATKKGKDGMVTRIVVGTPGRILDLMQEGVCDLSGVDYLVLDEADRMLDKGFENDIRNIISATKPLAERQTMMFSATWPEAVRRLASTFQRDPIRVTVGSDDLTANSRVEQSVEVFDDARSKDQRLLSHLRKLAHKKTTNNGATESRILIFALYKKEASRVEQMLHQQGYAVGALHGDMSQTARMETLERFKNGTTGLMVATDVAARGLDIPNVGAVINYTFPLTIEDYIHRIGRTGRGGKSGKSITFFTGENHERSLAGEFARVLREGGFDYEALKKFPMTIKKKEHSAYGAFFRDDIPAPKASTKIKF